MECRKHPKRRVFLLLASRKLQPDEETYTVEIMTKVYRVCCNQSLKPQWDPFGTDGTSRRRFRRAPEKFFKEIATSAARMVYD